MSCVSQLQGQVRAQFHCPGLVFVSWLWPDLNLFLLRVLGVHLGGKHLHSQADVAARFARPADDFVLLFFVFLFKVVDLRLQAGHSIGDNKTADLTHS